MLSLPQHLSPQCQACMQQVFYCINTQLFIGVLFALQGCGNPIVFCWVYFTLCEACCNCLQLKIYRVELGCGRQGKTLASFWAVQHKTKLLKFKELLFFFHGCSNAGQIVKRHEGKWNIQWPIWCLLLFRQEFPIRMLPK